jgi:oligosaccharide repeat unit polymerase
VGIGRYVDGGINPYAIYEAMGAAYGDISVVGIAYRTSVAFTYICAGILALDAMRPRRGNFIAFAFLAIVAAQSVFVSTRTTFLLAVSVMAMTMLCAHVQRFRRIPRRAISAILAMSLVAISTAAFASMRRYGLSVATISSNDFVDNQKVALLGAASNLSLFLDQIGIPADSEWTGITIAGVLGPLGLYERVAGVYIGSGGERQLTGESRQTTNQYTGLRLLLEDYGLCGTLVVMVILGMVITHVFVVNKRRPSIARIIILGNFYLLLLWLPITLLSYYAFWTIQFLVLLPLAKVFFRIPIAQYAGRTAAKRLAARLAPRRCPSGHGPVLI